MASRTTSALTRTSRDGTASSRTKSTATASPLLHGEVGWFDDPHDWEFKHEIGHEMYKPLRYSLSRRSPGYVHVHQILN